MSSIYCLFPKCLHWLRLVQAEVNSQERHPVLLGRWYGLKNLNHPPLPLNTLEGHFVSSRDKNLIPSILAQDANSPNSSLTCCATMPTYVNSQIYKCQPRDNLVKRACLEVAVSGLQFSFFHTGD